MIGVPFNPNNCIFIANQALNSNQFDPNVPDTGNLTTHTIISLILFLILKKKGLLNH